MKEYKRKSDQRKIIRKINKSKNTKMKSQIAIACLFAMYAAAAELDQVEELQ